MGGAGAVNFTIKNAETGKVYGHAPTLSAARIFCEQRLLKSSASREEFLSNLAAGLITVYEAHCLTRGYFGAGF